MYFISVVLSDITERFYLVLILKIMVLSVIV